MADKKTMVHVENLKKNFGKLEVLKDISVDIIWNKSVFQHLILSLHFHSLKMLHHHTFTTMSNFQMARQVKLYSLTTEV